MSEVLFVQNGWIQDGRVQDDCHHQVEWEWMSLSQIELVWVRVLCKMAESKMADFKMFAIIKLSQNEWVKFFLCKGLNPIQQDSRWLPSSSWVRMNEWSSFFVQNGWIKDGRFQDSYKHQVESEWMSLSQIELVWVRVLCKMAESKMAEFKMAAIIKLSQNEWVKFFFVQNGWIKDGRFQDSYNHQVESEWMSEVFLWKCWELILASVSEFERTN